MHDRALRVAAHAFDFEDGFGLRVIRGNEFVQRGVDAFGFGFDNVDRKSELLYRVVDFMPNARD